MSLYCPLYNHLFIHIPKCAGTSMAEAMAQAGSKPSSGHRTLGEYSVEGNLPSNIFKWCFVRNPYDRLVSAYLYHLARDGFLDEFPKMVIFMSSFENYILNLKEIKKMNMVHLKEQHSFIFSPSITMDFIGRYEDLEQDWNYISNKLYNRKLHLHTLNDSLEYAKAVHGSGKIANHIPREFTPEDKNYMTFYTPEMIKTVNEVYSKDFELFSYTKYQETRGSNEK